MTKGTQHFIAILVCVTLFGIWQAFILYVGGGLLVNLLFCAAIFGIGKFIWTAPLDEELEDKGDERNEIDAGRENDETNNMDGGTNSDDSRTDSN